MVVKTAASFSINKFVSSDSPYQHHITVNYNIDEFTGMLFALDFFFTYIIYKDEVELFELTVLLIQSTTTRTTASSSSSSAVSVGSPPRADGQCGSAFGGATCDPNGAYGG
ncbi:MAG: hypothetical protein M1812_000198 [Candelaria pacifica]|nr:MAG: hypothetical protein M1812_000198 [Candelaria pacifica]